MNIEHLKLNILQFFGDIYMNEEEHKYYLNNKPLKISVSGVIKNFYKPFDSYNISKNSAKKHGVTQESLLKEWDNNKDAACEKGNKAHKFGEVYPFTRSYSSCNGRMYDVSQEIFISWYYGHTSV